MIALTTVKELTTSIRKLDVTSKVTKIVTTFLPEIVEKSGIRNVEEIFDYLIESSYELLPLPVRLLIKKQVYIKVIKENKEKVINLISVYLYKKE